MLDSSSANFVSGLCSLDRLPSRFCNTVFVLYCKEGAAKPEDILAYQVRYHSIVMCMCYVVSYIRIVIYLLAKTVQGTYVSVGEWVGYPLYKIQPDLAWSIASL